MSPTCSRPRHWSNLTSCTKMFGILNSEMTETTNSEDEDLVTGLNLFKFTKGCGKKKLEVSYIGSILNSMVCSHPSVARNRSNLGGNTARL